MFERRMEPGTAPMSWEQFTTYTPPFSVALDGFVKEGPRFDPRAPRANFNHHEGVSRVETRATCAQALMRVRLGLFDTFKSGEGEPSIILYENDCDEDVSTADWVLSHPHLSREIMNPMLNRLVFMEDMLDTTAGAYPFPADLPSLADVLWVYEPYHRFRASGQIDKREPRAFESVVEDVGRRIMAYISGEGGRIKLDLRHEVIGGGKHWRMVREFGTHARVGVFASGAKAFVATRERPDGKYVYSLIRMPDYAPFPIPRLLEALNIAEASAADQWGGSDLAAGSPRVSGSRLKPEEITRIIEDCVR